MALTKSFQQTVKERAERDPEFRRGLLLEGLEELTNGDYEVARLFFRDYINATMGFQRAGEDIGIGHKSLMRMLSASGSPNAKNLLAIIHYLLQQEKIRVGIVVKDPKNRRVTKKPITFK